MLGYRAYAHRFAGDLAAATADMRAAYELDQSVDTRLLYVSILMDDPRAWRDGVQMARGAVRRAAGFGHCASTRSAMR